MPTHTPPPTATPTPTPIIYTVIRGDTLSSIADRFGTTVEAIAEANGLSVSTILRIGQQLIIPYPGPIGGPGSEMLVISTGTVITHVVQAGDSLYSIANLYGTTVEALMMVNGIKDPALIQADQELIISWETPEPTATATTPTPEPMATATAPTPEPTATATTLTPELTLTPTSTPTPTTTPTSTPSTTPQATIQTAPAARSAFPYPAPALLAPADGQVFQGVNEVIVLSWASVGILAEDEWYVLRLRYEAEEVDQPPSVWTKTTSWQVPVDLYPLSDAEAHLLHWDVTVMRQTQTEPDGTPGGVDISPVSDTRGFYWN